MIESVTIFCPFPTCVLAVPLSLYKHLGDVIKVICVTIIVEAFKKVDAKNPPYENEEYGDNRNIDDPLKWISEAL